jgi:hypothetical protein
MSDNQENTIVDLVRQVKTAIRRAGDRDPDKKLAITKVDLEIKVTFKKEIGASGKVTWLPIPIELSAHHKKAEVQTITMSLVPEQGPVLMGVVTVADELADAIQVVRAGVEEAAQSNPPFELKEAVISLNISTTNDGKVEVIVGGGLDVENAHTVKLTLTSAK